MYHEFEEPPDSVFSQRRMYPEHLAIIGIPVLAVLNLAFRISEVV